MAIMRSPQQLRAASEHIHYEIVMFDATARTLMAGGVFAEGLARNAFPESFAIHTRALLQFCFPSGAKHHDVLAEHYFDDPMKWRGLRGRLPKPLRAIDYRVGREIAHLTYDRLDVEPEERAWNVEDIRDEMMRLMAEFTEHASTQYLGPSWRRFPPVVPEGLAVWPVGAAATNHVTMINTPSVHALFQGPLQK